MTKLLSSCLINCCGKSATFSFLNNIKNFPIRLFSRKIDKMEEKAEMEEIKAEYLNMSLEDKRKKYRCKDDFFVLSDLPTWPVYFKERNLGSEAQPETPDPQPAAAEADNAETDQIDSPKNTKCQVDPELNEKITLFRGDITSLEIDAIVNAANSSLMGGGGVDGAIHRAAGNNLVFECEFLNGCPPGMAKISGGYRLPAKYVIHTVGPQGEKPDVLESCYKNSFNLMLENGLKSIAFCCISTGIYGYPNEPAAHVALSTARDFLEKNKDKVDRVIFTTFLSVDVEIYERLLQKYFPIQ